jgi:hypothetical protein
LNKSAARVYDSISIAGIGLCIILSEPGFPLNHLGRWILVPVFFFGGALAHVAIDQEKEKRKAKRLAKEKKEEK